ncbi:MAG: hypothetical protein JW827_01480 [Spirochaetes bacterium]|nr:hypothetical protein [Spirochaetota bacterium]
MTKRLFSEEIFSLLNNAILSLIFQMKNIYWKEILLRFGGFNGIEGIAGAVIKEQSIN